MDVDYKKNIRTSGEMMLISLNMSLDLAIRSYAALQRLNVDRKTLEDFALRIKRYEDQINRIECEMLNNNF